MKNMHILNIEYMFDLLFGYLLILFLSLPFSLSPPEVRHDIKTCGIITLC